MLKTPLTKSKLIPFAIENGIKEKVLIDLLNCSELTLKQYYSRFKRNMGVYNVTRIDDKYECNQSFLDIIKPKSVIDAFCGINSYYKDKFNGTSVIVSSNDLNIETEHVIPLPIVADYHMEALDFLNICESADLVDIDPFGCPEKYLSKAIELANKGLIITYGEYSSASRFSSKKNAKHSKQYYNFSSQKYDIKNVIKYTQELANTLGKTLEPILDHVSSIGVARIYYKVGIING